MITSLLLPSCTDYSPPFTSLHLPSPLFTPVFSCLPFLSVPLPTPLLCRSSPFPLLSPTLSPLSVKDQRDLKLFEAASEGRTLRLSAMCDAGVDVNARNKYGQVSSYAPPIIGTVGDRGVWSVVCGGVWCATTCPYTPGPLCMCGV